MVRTTGRHRQWQNDPKPVRMCHADAAAYSRPTDTTTMGSPDTAWPRRTPMPSSHRVATPWRWFR